MVAQQIKNCPGRDRNLERRSDCFAARFFAVIVATISTGRRLIGVAFKLSFAAYATVAKRHEREHAVRTRHFTT